MKRIISIFKSRQRKGIGLALGGGNIRGLAHVGVLKVLEKHNVKVGQLAGTSAGSIVAALYASGYTAQEIESIVMQLDWLKLISPSKNALGWFSGSRLEKFMAKHLKVDFFRDTLIPLSIVAADLITGKEYVFRGKNEPIALAVSASSAVPEIFSPVRYKGMLLLDGMMVNNMPVGVIDRKKVDGIIGVNVIPFCDLPSNPRTLMNVVNRAYDIRERYSFDKYEGKYDILLSPIKKYISVIKNGKKIYQEIIKMGEVETEKNIDKIKRYV